MIDNEIPIPTRDFLRQLIGLPKVKSTDLKNILRARGVFTGLDQKETLGPILIKTGLSPSEYIDLRESFKTKEESPKSKTRAIEWASDTDLIDAIPDSIDYEQLITDQFSSFKISTISELTTFNNNPNHLYIDFQITREDPVSNIGLNSSSHSGRVEIKKEKHGKLLTISLSHTAQETTELGNKISNKLIRHFKKNGHIDQNKDVTIIRYSDFTNESRILFLNELSQKSIPKILSFTDTKNIHFSPEEESKNLPTNIEWMKDKIDELKIKGKGLHSTFFVSDKSIHPFIKLFGLQCDYKIQDIAFSGTCRILFEFSNREESTDGELTLNLSMLKLETNEMDLPKNSISKSIMESLEELKISTYNKYKKQQTTNTNSTKALTQLPEEAH